MSFLLGLKGSASALKNENHQADPTYFVVQLPHFLPMAHWMERMNNFAECSLLSQSGWKEGGRKKIKL